MTQSFYRISSSGDKWYKPFKEIYTVSFPIHEQRTEAQQQAAFADDHYHLLVLIESDNLLSFIAYWDFSDYVYIEHLAVNPQFRGQEIGSKMLIAFAEKVEKTVLLEIDPLVDDISKKRLRFYKKLGYMVNPYEHFHPAYNPDYLPHQLLLLSHDIELVQSQFDKFSDDLANIVMANL